MNKKRDGQEAQQIGDILGGLIVKAQAKAEAKTRKPRAGAKIKRSRRAERPGCAERSGGTATTLGAATSARCTATRCIAAAADPQPRTGASRAHLGSGAAAC